MKSPSEARWYRFVAWFFGGAFLANTIPHLVNGISGSPFQSPFASPPGEGLLLFEKGGMAGFLGQLREEDRYDAEDYDAQCRRKAAKPTDEDEEDAEAEENEDETDE